MAMQFILSGLLSVVFCFSAAEKMFDSSLAAYKEYVNLQHVFDDHLRERRSSLDFPETFEMDFPFKGKNVKLNLYKRPLQVEVKAFPNIQSKIAKYHSDSDEHDAAIVVSCMKVSHDCTFGGSFELDGRYYRIQDNEDENGTHEIFDTGNIRSLQDKTPKKRIPTMPMGPIWYGFRVKAFTDYEILDSRVAASFHFLSTVIGINEVGYDYCLIDSSNDTHVFGELAMQNLSSISVTPDELTHIIISTRRLILGHNDEPVLAFVGNEELCTNTVHMIVKMDPDFGYNIAKALAMSVGITNDDENGCGENDEGYIMSTKGRNNSAPLQSDHGYEWSSCSQAQFNNITLINALSCLTPSNKSIVDVIPYNWFQFFQPSMLCLYHFGSTARMCTTPTGDELCTNGFYCAVNGTCNETIHLFATNMTLCKPPSPDWVCNGPICTGQTTSTSSTTTTSTSTSTQTSTSTSTQTSTSTSTQTSTSTSTQTSTSTSTQTSTSTSTQTSTSTSTATSTSTSTATSTSTSTKTTTSFSSFPPISSTPTTIGRPGSGKNRGFRKTSMIMSSMASQFISSSEKVIKS